MEQEYYNKKIEMEDKMLQLGMLRDEIIKNLD